MGTSKNPEYSSSSLVEFRTNQIKPFKSLFDSIKNNLPDTSIFFTAEGMKILQLDGASNFIVNVSLLAENFEHYFFQQPEGHSTVTVNVSTQHLNKAFKSVTGDDNLFRLIYERDSDVLKLEFCSEKKSECRTYEIFLQNPDEDVAIGEIQGTEEFPYCLTMPCADLQRICRDLKAQDCEKITISHDGESLKFTSKGSIRATVVRMGTKTDREGSVRFVKCPDEKEQTYSDVFKFSTLHDFSRSQSGCDSKIVKILLSQGLPIILYFEVGTLGHMEVAIAPYTMDQI